MHLNVLAKNGPTLPYMQCKSLCAALGRAVQSGRESEARSDVAFV
jgi:hypothetical protein